MRVKRNIEKYKFNPYIYSMYFVTQFNKDICGFSNFLILILYNKFINLLTDLSSKHGVILYFECLEF